jgi:imidazolonepropionase-like amidohydrolase
MDPYPRIGGPVPDMRMGIDPARRDIVHAHSAESAKAATLAGCTSIEHGACVTDEVFSHMEERRTYYDPTSGRCCPAIGTPSIDS